MAMNKGFQMCVMSHHELLAWPTLVERHFRLEIHTQMWLRAAWSSFEKPILDDEFSDAGQKPMISMNGGGLETAKIPLKLVTLLWIHVTPGRLPSQQQTNAPGLGPHLWDTWVMSFTSADFSMKLAWRGSQLLSDSSVLQHPRFRAGRNNST